MMMKHTSLLLLAVFMTAGLMSTALVAVGQESSDGPTPAWIADAGPADVVAPGAEVKAAALVAADPVAPADLLSQLSAAKQAYDELKAATGQRNLALWFALLAAITHLLLTLIKRLSGLTSKGKRFLPWVALGLGVAVGFFSAYTGNLATALVYGAGPPAAVLAQELGYGKLGQFLLDGVKLLLGRKS